MATACHRLEVILQFWPEASGVRPVLILHPTTRPRHELISNSSGLLAVCLLNALFVFLPCESLQKLLVEFEATKSQAVAVPLCSPAPSHPSLSICDMLRISLDVKATMLASEMENDGHSLLAFHSQAGGSDSSCSFRKCFLSSHCRAGFSIVTPFTGKRLPRVDSTNSPYPALCIYFS